jgi:cell division control protein 6
MTLFDDMLKDEESLFTDEHVLDFDYLPDLLPYRENQQGYIADCIKPLVAGRPGKNLFIHGAPGVGKTSCIRFVFEELKKSTDAIKPVYINCWKKPTTNAVLTEVASQLGSIGAHYKTNEELWAKVEKGLSRSKGVVIALDEIDKAKEQDFLYQILENIRAITVLMISNDKAFLANVDGRIRSRLTPEELEFPPYKLDEVRGILEERKNAAFVPGVWGEEAFGLVVDKTYEQGDMRVGLSLLRESGRAAESDASRRVTVEHAMRAKGKMVDFRMYGSGDLGEKEALVLSIIEENSGIETGELTEMLKKRAEPIADSSLRRIIQRLDKGGYIFREEVAAGYGKGKTMKHFIDK